MNCSGCGVEAKETWWGPWCDRCGGVMIGDPPKLFFRHVATVDGPGGRFSVVYDISTADYAVTYPRLGSTTVQCRHCGQETPVDPEGERRRAASAAELGFHLPPVSTTHGSLDAVLAAIQPFARGKGDDIPELSRAPSATAEECALLGIE
jgi:hypothetical protein